MLTFPARGSPDRRIRTAALDSLRTFLPAQAAAKLSPLDLLKLWKGLFVSLWMCDRPVPQQNLCADLAGLIEILPRDAVVPWLRGFWATMAREWTTGIDVHRMNKFLLLVRRVLEKSLRWMRRGGQEKKGDVWDAQRTDQILGLLEEWPFAGEDEVPRDTAGDPYTVPSGLRIHILDIWVDEAEKAGLLEEDDEQAKDIMGRISALVDALERNTTSTAVRIRAKESLEDDRLPGNQGKSKGEDDSDEEMVAGDEDKGSWDGFDD